MARRTEGASGGEKRRTPEFATQASGISHPHLDVSAPYYLAFHPDRWCVVAGRLIPALGRVPLVAGVNGVEVDKNGRVRFAAARAKLETEGRTLIPYAWAPDGESYLQCLDTKPNGGKDIIETWISVFEGAEPGARETDADEEGYAAWVAGLVDSGKLPRCSLPVARKLLDKAVARLEKAKADAAKLDGHGQASIRARALEAEVKVLKDYVDGAKGEKAKAKAKRTPAIKEEAEATPSAEGAA